MDFGHNLNLQGVARVKNMAPAVDPADAVNLSQLLATQEGLSWKDSARVYMTSNINLASPGASLDGIAMAVGDRFAVGGQTTQSQNGIYIYNGSAVAAARSPDANTADELEGAIFTVEEGTNAGTQWRQTQVNFTLGSGNVLFMPMGTAAPQSSTTVSGTIRQGTQAEVNAKTAGVALTPETAAAASWMLKKLAADIGDGSATTFTVTHNLNTLDVEVAIYKKSNGAKFFADVVHATVNTVTVTFISAPASAEFRVVVIG